MALELIIIYIKTVFYIINLFDIQRSGGKPIYWKVQG